MLKTKTLEMGGFHREDFVSYLYKIGGKTDDQKLFKGDYWGAMVGPETLSTHSILRIPHVSITFNVEENKFDEFLAEFRINFLRGGG